MKLTNWCDRVIHIGFFLLFALVPLLLTPWNYELFEFNKMMAVYGLTVVIVGAWMLKMISQKEFRIARTPLDIPLALFLSSQLLSSLLSIDPHISWFGYYSRFNGGMWSVISYVLLYYAFVSNFRSKSTPTANGSVSEYQGIKGSKKLHPISDTLTPDTLTHFLKLALASASVVSLYAVAERLGIDKHLWVQDVQTRVFSTLGQPNWLAAYLVALIPLAMAFFVAKSDKQKAISKVNEKTILFDFLLLASHLSHIALFFLVLLFTRSRSGLFGFVVADIVFWGLVFWNFTRRATLLFLLLHFSFFLIIFFNGTHIDSLDRFVTFQGLQHAVGPKTNNDERITKNESTPSGTLLETGGTESGTIRKYVWQGAINAWRSSTKTLLIGTGTETFAFAFYQFKPKAHNLTSEWDFLYNKAHNEYLNYLATTGLFGLGSYLLFIGVFIVWFIKYQEKNKSLVHDTLTHDTLTLALFSGWLSIVVTNFFGFSVVIVQLMFFLFPAFVVSRIKYQVSGSNIAERKLFRVVSLAFNEKLRKTISLALFLVFLALLVFLSLLWYADTRFAAGYRLNRVNQFSQAELLLTRAIQLNPYEPLYYDERSSARTGLVDLDINAKQATAAALQAKRAMEDSDKALTIAPRNVNYWKSRTKMYYAFSSFDPEFNTAAITALVRGQELSPLDPKITYNLAILYGRQNDMEKAIELLKQSIDLKPNYRDAYYALHIFYSEAKKPDLAKQVLSDYLTKVDPNDKDFVERIK